MHTQTVSLFLSNSLFFPLPFPSPSPHTLSTLPLSQWLTARRDSRWCFLCRGFGSTIISSSSCVGSQWIRFCWGEEEEVEEGREVKKWKQTRAIFFAPYVYLNWISVTVNTDAHTWTKVRHDIMYTMGTHNDTMDRHVWCSKLSIHTTTRNCSHTHARVHIH